MKEEFEWLPNVRQGKLQLKPKELKKKPLQGK